MKSHTREKVRQRMEADSIKLGPFSSPNEAVGTALMQWYQLLNNIAASNAEGAKTEALNVAAVLIRFAEQQEFPSR